MLTRSTRSSASARRPSASWSVLAVLDVLGDTLLEGLERLEQLVGRNLALRLVGAEEPRRGVDRRVPGRLLDLLFVRRLPFILERLDVVQVDVRETVPFLLVEADAGTTSLGLERPARDPLAKGRVLVAVLVDEDERVFPERVSWPLTSTTRTSRVYAICRAFPQAVGSNTRQ
jgi:hypothetical protein